MSVNKQKINVEPSQEITQELRQLIKLGQFKDAEIKAKQLNIRHPNSSTILNLIGVSLIAQHKFDEAEKNFNKLIKIKPDFAEAYNNLANIYMNTQKIKKAIKYFDKAITLKSDLNQAHFNLSKIYTDIGNSFQRKGEITESIINYKNAIKHNVNYADAHNNLGIALQSLEKNDEAISSFKNAIKIKKDYFEAHNNLGNTFLKLHKTKEAIKCFEEATKIKPDYIEAHNNLGAAYNKINDFENAVFHFNNAIKLKPDFIPAYSNLAASLTQQGENEKAVENYNIAFKLDPTKTEYTINSNLILPAIPESIKDINLWREKYISAIEKLKKNKYQIDDPQKVINPSTFYLAYNNLNNLEIMKKVSGLFREIIPIINYKANLNNKNNKKIKLGFVSDFFTNHTIGKLFRGIIKKIDRNLFEVLIFHTSNTKPGEIKNEIDATKSKIITLCGKIKNQQKQIENENIDILFYTDIGMTTTTYFLAHARLATIQFACYGHPDTSGIETIDYFLSSSNMETKDSNQFYSEKLICIDPVFINLTPPEKPKINLNKLDFGLSENNNIYCCPQTLFKIHPEFDLALAKIVEKDSKAQIVMIETKQKVLVDKLKIRWSRNFPVLNKKVTFLKSMSLDKFLSLIEISNVLLDPFYFGGGLSFAETLVVGTPTVTMPTKFMRSRVTSGLYKQMKIPNPPIARNVEEYVELATELAKNTKKNYELRKLLQRAAKIHLFNNSKSLKQFEKVLIESYQIQKKGLSLKDGYVI